MKIYNALKFFSLYAIHAVSYTLFAVLLLAGCATAPPEEHLPEYVWPPPPDIPRIKWVRQWSGQTDFERVTGLSALITGEEEGLNLSRPNGVIADSAGNIFVSDLNLGVIFVFDQGKRKVRIIGAGVLRSPIGLAIDNSTRILYVTDSVFDRVFGFDKDKGDNILTIGNPGDFKNPTGIAVDEKRDRIFIAETNNHAIKVFKRNGEFLFTIGSRGTAEGKLNFPSYLAVDKEGKLYVSDSFNFRVQIFNPDGKFLRTFGKLGDAGGTFTRLKGIGVDSDNNIYTVDAAFNNMQVFDLEGRLLLFVGEGGGEPGQFYFPAGMYIDAQDRIYIADTFNKRVQVFQYLKQK